MRHEQSEKKKLFLFDIDGTIAVGNTLFDGSAELISYIKSIGGAACFITNNSTKSNDDYVKNLQNALGLPRRKNSLPRQATLPPFLCRSILAAKNLCAGNRFLY